MAARSSTLRSSRTFPGHEYAREHFEHLGIHAANLASVLCVDIAQHMLDQQRDVVLAFAQRRQMNVEYVQAEIEILAQLALCYSLLGLLIRRGKHAHVHRRFHLAAEPAHFMVLQHAEQLCLRRRRHLADFIEKQRAAVGHFKTANPPLGRPRKRTAFVPENFTFHQGFGNRRTIDGNKGPIGAG